MRTVKIILGDEFTMFNTDHHWWFQPPEGEKKHMWNHQKIVYGDVLMPKPPKLTLRKCNQ